MARLQARQLVQFDRCTRFHQPQCHAIHRRREVSVRAFRTHQSGVGQAAALLQGRAKEGRACRRCENTVDGAGAQGRLYRPRQRGDRRIANRPALQAGDLSIWWVADGGGRAQGSGIRGRPPGARGLHEVPEVTQRRRVRRLYARDHEVPKVRHHYRASGRLWPRPDHRRLSPGRPLWHRPPDRSQEGGTGANQRHVADRRDHPPARGNGRADPRAGRPGRDGEAL